MTPAAIVAVLVLSLFLLYSYQRQRGASQCRDTSATVVQKLKDIKEKLIKVEPKVQEMNLYTDDTESYILHKRDIFLCMKNDGGEYHDDNFLMYIALHEVAHALLPGNTDSHPPEFEEKFKQLKERATYLGVYDPNIPFPKRYCKKKISDYMY